MKMYIYYEKQHLSIKHHVVTNDHKIQIIDSIYVKYIYHYSNNLIIIIKLIKFNLHV